MADWRETAKLLVLADGTIDDNEVKILRKAILADDYVDQDEIAFLVDLRSAARKKAKGEVNANFEKLFTDAVTKYVVGGDGGISAEKTAWLKANLFPTKKADEGSKKLLGKLKKSVTHESPAFNTLHDEVVGAGAAPKKAKAKA
jgi:hypothetical protein